MRRKEVEMQAQKYFHKCGHAILEVKMQVGPVVQSCYVDADNPFTEGKDGAKTLRPITQCPECNATIRPEKLLTKKPDASGEKKPTGYIPVKM